MEITTKLIDQLREEGISHDTHHATVKSTIAGITGEKPTSEEYREVRDALKGNGKAAAGKAAKVPTGKKAKKAKASGNGKAKRERKAPEPLSATAQKKVAKEIIAERADDEDMPGWENVEKATETNDQGVPLRVQIRCSDPQEGVKCEKTREIAAQDVFQVKRCTTCQKRYTQNYRNELAKRRRQEAKASA